MVISREYGAFGAPASRFRQDSPALSSYLTSAVMSIPSIGFQGWRSTEECLGRLPERLGLVDAGGCGFRHVPRNLGDEHLGDCHGGK